MKNKEIYCKEIHYYIIFFTNARFLLDCLWQNSDHGFNELTTLTNKKCSKSNKNVQFIIHYKKVHGYQGPFKKYVLNFWTNLDPSLPSCVIMCYFSIPLLVKYVLNSKTSVIISLNEFFSIKK